MCIICANYAIGFIYWHNNHRDNNTHSNTRVTRAEQKERRQFTKKQQTIFGVAKT
jgi:hypothetical protein